MSDEFREEEFDRSFNGGTLLRILKLTIPHWHMLAIFTVAIGGVAYLEAYLTLLNARIIDEALLVGDVDRLWEIATWYGIIWIGFAFLVFLFIYYASKLGQQVQYDLRKR
ncbi:MAG: hypothetical protein AAF126_24110, partial [Chloroflexota bacterium]